MIITTVLAGVEQAVNHLLPLDQEIANALFTLEGKVLKIHLTDLDIQTFVLIRSDCLSLSAHYDGEVDAALSGPSWVLLRSYTEGVRIGSGLSMDGDMVFVERFSELMRQFRIDWEELLSNVVGDIAAHKIHGTISGVVSWGKDALQRVQWDLSDYVHEEVRLVPPRLELEDFYQSIVTLRDGVERVEARINRLQQRQEKA